MTMPGRGHGRPTYSPMDPEASGAIYAKIDRGRKTANGGSKRFRDVNSVLNTSSDSSVREGGGCGGESSSDSVSVETPLVTSEDGRSSSNSEESRHNRLRIITYDDRESRV